MSPPNFLTSFLAHNLFLRSHGIRDPLTTIRWGIELLRKGHLTPKEQEHYINELSAQTKILSTILESSLLVEEVKEKAYIPGKQDICLPALLNTLTKYFDNVHSNQWTIDCPHIHISTDRKLLQMILRNILTISAHYCSDPLILSLQAKEAGGEVHISISSLMIIPTLSVEENPFRKMPALIVGPSGLLLATADMLAASCNGSIEVEKKHHGVFVPASMSGDDSQDSTAQHYRLVCRLGVPMHAVEGDFPCRTTNAGM